VSEDFYVEKKRAAFGPPFFLPVRAAIPRADCDARRDHSGHSVPKRTSDCDVLSLDGQTI